MFRGHQPGERQAAICPLCLLSFAPRPPMERIPRHKTFSFYFRNLPKTNIRNCNYLCFEVRGKGRPSDAYVHRGVFQNQVRPMAEGIKRGEDAKMQLVEGPWAPRG